MPEPDARFTLANERTFLAWTRTALALVAGGLAVAHFLDDVAAEVRLPLAIALVAFGGYVSTDSYRRWRANDAALRAGRPLPPSPLPAILVTGVGLAAVVAVVLVVASEV